MRWRNALLLLVLGYFFLFLFEPFNVNRTEHLFPFWLICLIQISSVVCIYILLTGALQLIVSEDDWTIFKEILLLMGLMLLIGIANYALREVIYDNPENRSVEYLIEEIRNAFLVGTLILFVLTMINARLLERDNQRKTPIPKSGDHQPVHPPINLPTASANETLTLYPDQLLCIKADGNYLEVYQYRAGTCTKDIIRLTLQEAAHRLERLPNLLQTHRAYLVNLDQVTKATGNAQGYQLEIAQLPFSVPVTRKHLPAFREAMSSV